MFDGPGGGWDEGGDQCAGPASELRWLGWDVLADCAYRQLLLRLASFKCRDSLDGCYRSWDAGLCRAFRQWLSGR